MKWQVLMVSLAVAVALFLGASRWRDRLTAESELSGGWKKGGWVLVQVGYSADGPLGVTAQHSPFGSAQPLKGFAKIAGYEIGGFDITPDLERLAWVDNANYNQPELHIGDGDHPDRSHITLPDTAKAVACPLFEPDGSVLLLTGPPNTANTLGRLPEQARHPELQRLPGLPLMNSNICPALSDDGKVLAFMGTDGFIHLALRDLAGDFQPEAQVAGSDFQLAPDGSWLAVLDGRLQRYDVAAKTTREITAENKGEILAISPDGNWILSNEAGTWGQQSLNAIRVRDGVVVPVSGGSPFPGRRGERWRPMPKVPQQP